MQVEWLEKALKNLEDEANYIALENPKAADDFPTLFSPASTTGSVSIHGPRISGSDHNTRRSEHLEILGFFQTA